MTIERVPLPWTIVLYTKLLVTPAAQLVMYGYTMYTIVTPAVASQCIDCN